VEATKAPNDGELKSLMPKSLKIANPPGNLRSSNLRSPRSCLPATETANATWFVDDMGVASFPCRLLLFSELYSRETGAAKAAGC